MRRPVILAIVVLGGIGCARVLGVDFGAYREGQDTKEDQLLCVPNEVSRCLCELKEGVRGCDDAGHLLPCVCSDTDGGSCGNGVVDVGEACDDGDNQDGNGCSNACVPNGRPPVVEQCPGQALTAWPGHAFTLQLAGSVRAASADASPGCGSSSQPDRFFQVKAKASGTLRFDLTASVPTFMSVRTDCGNASSALSCDSAPADERTSRAIEVAADQVVFLVLEPTQSSPTATFTIEVTPP